MSHIGQLYPVAFRRDLSLNVTTNRAAWGNRELVFWGQFPTGPAGVWSNSHWDCGPATVPFVNTLRWDSEHVLKFGVHWWTRFQVTISGNVQMLPILQLNTEEFGNILEITYALQRQPVTSASTGIAPEITFWDTGFFDEFPSGALGSTWRWKFWADGPPN